MSHADFDDLLHRRPALVYELVRIFSERLQQSNNSTIRELRANNEVLQTTLDQLQAAQAQLIQQEKLAHELAMAREIQLSIVPRDRPAMAGYDCGALMVPARAVGGDFFDFVRLDENRLGLVIGDVSDKGVPAAIFMALTHSLLRAEGRRGGAPAEVLASVNRQLCEMNDQGMFVTVLYGILDVRTGHFTYARAGHELPLLINHHGQTERPELGLGQPLAIFLDSAIDEQRLTLTPGSTLLLYTDGVTEATNAAKALFGQARLVSALHDSRHLPAQALCQQLLQVIRLYEEDTAAFDDVTLVAIHRRSR
jgi:sigma-B regulation protein RsbU (phosphoserine phosphatase)